MALALTPWLWALAARPRLFMLEPFSLQIMRSSAPPDVPGRPADADGRPLGVGLIAPSCGMPGRVSIQAMLFRYLPINCIAL